MTNWLDRRTGYRHIVRDTLYENIPGGSRWIYVTGSMLVFAFVTQVITGLILWMSYSPSSQTAWESVYYITNEVQGGWLLRGVHHYMAQAMVALLPLHLLQVVLCRAYVAPREINYWLGLILMVIVATLGLTGYLLPWDQKGYWATKVATELMALPPGGAYIQKLVVGGDTYGHATLSRFFAMHAGVLPILLSGVLALHLALFRKHGITARSSPSRPDETFWPKQILKDATACVVMLAVVVALTVWRGAELGPPAEPTELYQAARPEWYFLFLFQLLKKFESSEFVGAIVVPGLIMLFLLLLPIIAKVRFGHIVNVVVVLALLGGGAYLTFEALDHDNYHLRHAENPPADEAARQAWSERIAESENFHEARQQAHHDYQRVQELIEYYGIPPIGAADGLVAKDPEIQGPRLFRRRCAMCHSYLDENGQGIAGPRPPEDDPTQPYGAPNLYGFASPDWFMRFLDPKRIVSDEVFGLTVHKDGQMAAEFVALDLAELDEQNQEIRRQITLALSAEAKLIWRQEEEKKLAEEIKKGVAGLEHTFDSYACIDCHKYHDLGDLGAAPDLTNYGSYRWLYDFIANPAHDRFYSGQANDRMPAFGGENGTLNHHEIDMLVRWLRGDDRNLSLLSAGGATGEEAESEK